MILALGLLASGLPSVTELGISAAVAGVVVGLTKLFPERRNLSVDSAQKSVETMRSIVNEFETQLARAQEGAQQLSRDLTAKIAEIHELEKALGQERLKVIRLQHQLEELERQYGTPTRSG